MITNLFNTSFCSHSQALQVMSIYGESEENGKRGRFYHVLHALKNSKSVLLKVKWVNCAKSHVLLLNYQ